jgi:hypothetical protein
MSPRTREQMADDMADALGEVQPVVWLELALHGLLLCGGIAYVTFGIVFLVNDSSACGGYSNFWALCCAQLVSAVISYLISTGIYVKDTTAPDGVGRMSYINLAVYILIEIPFFVWGFINLYINDSRCTSEMHLANKLYIWAQISLWVRAIYLILVIIGSIVASLRKPMPKEIEEDC